MQEPTSRFLCGCFGKRGRVPERLPGKNDGNNTENYTDPPKNHAKSPDTYEITSLHKNAAYFASSTDKLQHEPESPSGTDPLTSAFHRACSRLSEDQIKTLENTQGLQELFEQLDAENEKSKETSPFRKGAQRLGPVLNVLGGAVRLASPLAALDPVAGNAFGIIQSVMTIAIGICGAEAKFQESVEAMLQSIPIIERCDDIWDSTRSPESLVDSILVRIYTNLLEFYFAAMDVVKGGSFFVNLQKSRFKDMLPGIVASFTANADQLDKALNMEAVNLIQKIDDEQSDLKLRMLLNSGSQNKEVDYYNSLQKRADKACAWIVSTVDFREWLDESNGGRSNTSARFCILFGNMGSGKSVTTSFVADFLVSHPALSGSLKPFVCVYYCKNDNETNKARNIYRSILSQILTRMVQLKARFMEWYKEAQTKNSLVDPTLDDNALRDFLVSVLRQLSRRLYLIMDWVDECDYDNRDHLLHFFEKFNEHGAPVNVFLSCRYDEAIKARLPPGRRILQMNASLDRDHIIASFHVNQILIRQPEEVRKLIISELAKKADGSAIWLKMVLEYLRRPHRSEREIKRLLERMPSPQSLSVLYRKLFEEAARGGSSDAARIEYSLEALAVSGRLLTLDELACVVTLRIEKDNISSLADLEECMIDSMGLLELINPFVRIKDTAGNAIVQIVHQSLKELIIREAPEDWGLRDGGMSTNKKNREQMLHSSLLECCIKYLLLADLEEKDLFPKDTLDAMEEQAYDREFFAHFDICTDESEADDKPSESRHSTSGNIQTRDFDPELAGFGKLFMYAACHWTEHLKYCSPDALPSVAEVSKLSRHGSLTLRNWMETYKRPAMTSSPQINLDVKDFDELFVAAHFGSHAFLSKFLAFKPEDSIREESAAKVLKWLLQSGDLDAASILLQNPAFRQKLQSGPVICDVMTIWNRRDPAKQTDTAFEEKWAELLTQLTKNFISPISSSSLSWANTLLCSASRQGCPPVLHTLFESARSQPTLTTALLAETQIDSPYQSIGEAAFWNQPHILRYLLEQQSHVDMTPHLRHHTRSPSGAADRNVLHLAANARNPDIFRMLCRAFPQGVNATTASGDTPLILLVFARPTSVEAVKVLLEVGGADVNFSPGGEWYSPLRTAVRAGDVGVVECLVKGGARVKEALVEGEGGWRLKGEDVGGEIDSERERRMVEVLVKGLEGEMGKGKK